MGNPVEIKALFFTLIRGSPGAEIVFLNQNLAIRPTSVLRDFNSAKLLAHEDAVIASLRAASRLFITD
jgi:hypothetical protein